LDLALFQSGFVGRLYSLEVYNSIHTPQETVRQIGFVEQAQAIGLDVTLPKSGHRAVFFDMDEYHFELDSTV
jgi:hypothetical protein